MVANVACSNSERRNDWDALMDAAKLMTLFGVDQRAVCYTRRKYMFVGELTVGTPETLTIENSTPSDALCEIL